MGDVVSGDHQIVAILIDPTQNDMRVRMAGVVVIDGDPFELGSQVPLHLVHERPGVARQIFQLLGVFGRDDEAELMPVALRPISESVSVRFVAPGVVKPARFSVLIHAVALNVFEMQTGRIFTPAGELYDPRFDNYAAHSVG